MRISLEGFLLVNFLMDLSVLYLAGRGIWFVHLPRLLFGAAFGALYAVWDVLFSGGALTRFAAFFVMLAIAFPLGELTRFLKACGMAAVASVMIAGAAMLFEAHTHPKGALLFMGIPAAFSLMGIWKGASAHSSGGHVRVRITYHARTAEFDALIDTGNLLTEPVSALPVLIADEKALGEKFVRRTNREGGARMVSFTTVAGEGEIRCVRADSIQLKIKRSWVTAPDMWVGVYPGRIRSDVHALVPGSAVRVS